MESESLSCSVVSDCLQPHGLLQARILKWVAFPFSRGSSQPRDRTQVSCIAGGFFTSWNTWETQEYWSEQPIPSPVDLPNPGIEPGSPALQADSLPAEPPGKLNWIMKILKDDAISVLHSRCQQIWKHWQHDWKRSVFAPIPKKGNAKECLNYHTIEFTSHTNKVMIKILQARLHQYMNWECPDVQARFRKGRGTRQQIANIHCTKEKARWFRKISISSSLMTLKPLTM